MMIIRQSTHILTIITREMGKLNTYSRIYCMKDNWEAWPNLRPRLIDTWQAFYKFNTWGFRSQRGGNAESIPMSYTWIMRNRCVLVCVGRALQSRHNGRDGVSNHQPHHCLLNRLFWCRSKKTSKFCVTGLCVGNSPVIGEFPAQEGLVTMPSSHLNHQVR